MVCFRGGRGGFVLAIGVLLVLVNFLEYVLELNPVSKGAGEFGGKVAGYDYSIRGKSQLLEMLERPVGHFDVANVNNIVFETIAHGGDRKIQPYENWLLWLGGKFYDPLSRTQNPKRIVSGSSALCSEVAAVFNSISGLNGLDARFVSLDGHVVSEVHTADGWRIVDPDYGVAYSVGLDVLETEEGVPLMRKALVDRGYSAETVRQYIDLFQTSSNNKVAQVGAALSPRLYVVEIVSDYLKWVIPLVILLLGFVSIGKSSK